MFQQKGKCHLGYIFGLLILKQYLNFFLIQVELTQVILLQRVYIEEFIDFIFLVAFYVKLNDCSLDELQDISEHLLLFFFYQVMNHRILGIYEFSFLIWIFAELYQISIVQYFKKLLYSFFGFRVIFHEICLNQRVLDLLSLAIYINQIVHRLRLQMFLYQLIRVSEVFKKKQKLTWVNICWLKPLYDFFWLPRIEQLPSCIQMESLQLLQVVAVRFRTSCYKHLLCFFYTSLLKQAFNLFLIGDFSHCIYLRLDRVFGLFRVVCQKNDLIINRVYLRKFESVFEGVSCPFIKKTKSLQHLTV